MRTKPSSQQALALIEELDALTCQRFQQQHNTHAHNVATLSVQQKKRLHSIIVELWSAPLPQAGQVFAGAYLRNTIGRSRYGTFWHAETEAGLSPCTVHTFDRDLLGEGLAVHQFRAGVRAMLYLQEQREHQDPTQAPLLASIRAFDPDYLAYAVDSCPSARLSALQHRRKSLQQKLSFFSTIARALHFAHTRQRPVLYGVLNPHDIWFHYGTPLLLDLSTACFGSEPQAPNLYSQPDRHSRLYTAPELLQAQPVTPSLRSDIYSLGTLLSFLLLEKEPSLFDIGQQTQEALRGFPTALQHIVGRCCALRPSQRYTSISEILDDLHQTNEAKLPARFQASSYHEEAASTQVKTRERWLGGLLILSLLLLCGQWLYFAGPSTSLRKDIHVLLRDRSPDQLPSQQILAGLRATPQKNQRAQRQLTQLLPSLQDKQACRALHALYQLRQDPQIHHMMLAPKTRRPLRLYRSDLSKLFRAPKNARKQRTQRVELRASLRLYCRPKLSWGGLALSHLDLSRASMPQAQMHWVLFDRVRLNDSQLTRSVWRQSTLFRSRFDRSHLVNADFRFARLEQVSFRHTKLRGARFAFATLRGVHFAGSVLYGVDFRDAHFQDKSKLVPGGPSVNLVKINIQGAFFSADAYPFWKRHPQMRHALCLTQHPLRSESVDRCYAWHAASHQHWDTRSHPAQPPKHCPSELYGPVFVFAPKQLVSEGQCPWTQTSAASRPTTKPR